MWVEGTRWDVKSSMMMQEQMIGKNVERFRGGLVSKAHRLLYHSTLGSRVMKKKRMKKVEGRGLNVPVGT